MAEALPEEEETLPDDRRVCLINKRNYICTQRKGS